MAIIFDDKARVSQRPMAHGENLYEYYDQSGRSLVADKRHTLNRWASRYPERDVTELRARMMSSTRQFQAAELELALHEVFWRQRLSPIVHPQAPSGKKFDLELSHGDFSAYVEITALLQSNNDVAEENRVAAILNALNGLRLPEGHSFLVSIDECGDQSPSLRRITAAAERWAATAAPAQTPFPELVIEDAGWKIELTLVNSGSSRIYDRAVGGFTGGATWASPGDDLKAKLQSKARRYGRPDRVFIIAIADFRVIAADSDEVCEALFGEWATVVERATFNTSRKFRPNGFFGHSGQPQNTAVSAVLVLPGDPYWAAQNDAAKPILYLNPFAENPVPIERLPFSVRHLDGAGRIVAKDGPTLQDLLM